MIHACPERYWYVKGFLIPSLLAQGIPENDISVWLDHGRKGNLASCLASFRQCAKKEGETWHLQDDVIVCSDFYQRTRAAPDGIVCGFCVDIYESYETVEGKTTGKYMWQSSFPCIKIPNGLAGEFVKWVKNASHKREEIRRLTQTGKKDDTLFWIFIQENYPDMTVTNMTPHLADHVDYLIGGSTINEWRDGIVRSSRWREENLILELAEKLAGRD